VVYRQQGQTNAKAVTCGLISCLLLLAGSPACAEEKVVFDFKDDASLKGWEQYLPENPKVPGYKEPAVKIALAEDPEGRVGLKLTYAGGKLPAVATRSPVEDWFPYKTFKAEVTVTRPCIAAFRVVNLNDERHQGWVKIALLKKGANVVIDQAPTFGQQFGPQIKKGEPTQFEILMYSPHDGESLWVHNITVSTEPPTTATPYFGDHIRMGDTIRPWTAKTLRIFPKVEKIRVLGRGAPITSVAEFSKEMTANWVPTQEKTVEQVEADFDTFYKNLKKDHPRAVAAILRDGQKGYDPASPERAYAGWACTATSAHGPDAVQLEIVKSPNNWPSSDRMEMSLRGRPPFLRCDLSSIPKGSNILAARLLIVRATPVPKEWENRRPYFVAKFCNRPWKDTEINIFEYAKDKYWQELLGMDWHGDDPDFLPIVIAHGPSQQTTSIWDFTEAVRWWADGKQPNYGFTINNAVYGQPHDPLQGYTNRAKDVQNRPAMLVIYEPKP
jgi:hypothetical protein